MSENVERWGIYELTVTSDSVEGEGLNPFTDVEFGAVFTQGHRTIEARGFYDGGGVYKVRLSPDSEGAWTCVTTSDRAELDGRKDAFTCTPPGAGNHGPVRVARQFHFAYADGTPYKQIGTTCYVWNHQGDALEEQTLESLAALPFNKIRFCVFPKDYDYNRGEPESYPHVKGPSAEGQRYTWDFTRFDPAFWRHFELRIGQLRDLGIEADIIVFHPYDRWGFKDMGREADDLYLEYLIARVSCYRNVWWSMANEYDLMNAKSASDWDRFFETFQRLDPHDRLRGVHNCGQDAIYDNTKPWVTHSSLQSSDLYKIPQWRAQYGKPVVVDECCYEGNVPHCWGNITGEEMTRRFWRGTVLGGYVGHGETYVHKEEILWWSKGGRTTGTSPARIAFLRRILEEGPAEGLDPGGNVCPACEGMAHSGDEYFLGYFGVHQPGSLRMSLPEGREYRIDAIDTWEMKITTLRERALGTFEMEFAGRPSMAIRIEAV